MSVRVDTTSLITGACVVGNRGLGLPGSVIRGATATGAHGPGFLYNDLTSSDDGKEIRGLIVTPPSSGVFIAYEDGSFSLAGAGDGAYSFTYRLYVDGADLGTTTASVTLGASTATATVSVSVADAGDDVAAASASTPAAGGAPPVGVAVTVADTGDDVAAVSLDAAPAGGGGLALTAAEQRAMFNWVRDLAQIHGLVAGAPLVVTPTARQAGEINQSISESGVTVTVSRLS